MTELQRQLIDLYAGRELDTDGERALEESVADDAAAVQDMKSLRDTVDALNALPKTGLSEEGHERILMRLAKAGVEPKLNSPTPRYWQYQFPLDDQLEIN